MAKIKYYYDPDTCKYERATITRGAVIMDAILSISLILIAALGIAIL